jgi:hypothetical protein
MPRERHAVRQPDDVRMGAMHAVRRAPFVHRAGLDYQLQRSRASIKGACLSARVNHIDREPWLRRLLVGLLAALEGDDYVAGRAIAATRMRARGGALSPGLPRLSPLPCLSRLPCFSRLMCLRRVSC